MAGISYDLVQEIAIALNAQDSPPMKDGVAYRIIVFKVADGQLWVVGMVPDFIGVEDLFTVVNESYDLFLKGETTPNGIVFLSAEQPEQLTLLAKAWYYGEHHIDDSV